ncbi:MAG: hypothetical protein H6839_08675 [Planctomycetes bacterium]|nr:hypothetical protein [Planctomycetota bacterium]
MTRTLRFALAALVLFAFATHSSGEPTDTANSTKLKSLIADELVDIAGKAEDSKLFDTAAKLLDEALGLAPDHRKAAKAKDKLKETGDTDDAEALATYEKKSEKYRKKAALGYCGLFDELSGDKDTTTVDAWLERAYQLHAAETDDWVEKEYKSGLSGKKYQLVYRMLGVAARFDTGDESRKTAREKAFRECVAALSVKKPILMKCRDHDMCYYLSMPEGWTMDKEWPIVVAQEGAGSNFEGMNRAAAKDNKWFIVITCCTFSNTNSLDGQAKKYPYPQEFLDKWSGNRLEFDAPGLLAVMKEVRELYNGSENICITGYSGGGILTWHMVFKHPDKVVAAVPACANFAGAAEVSDDAEAKKKIIVHAYQGDKDGYKESMLDGQWEAAKKLADANGYEHVTRDIIPGGHIACHSEARKVFLEAWGLSDDG